MSFDRWPPYVPVAQRRAKAQREMKKLRKQGKHIEPVEIEGRNIARSFWGKGWCKHLEQFSDYDNRLPRGRTYVRNGSVAHLAISSGKVEAIVNGSVLYNINITIKPLPKQKWDKIRQQCTGQIGSMLELLQGKLSNQVMQIVTDPDTGLFPNLREIELSCNCPDWADMCKHIAAVLYGIGARLDHQPELLFLLRNVDHQALISAELDMHAATGGTGKRRRLASENLSDVFGVDIDEPLKPVKRKASSASKKVTTRKVATKKSVAKKRVIKKDVAKKSIAKKSSIKMLLAMKSTGRKSPPKNPMTKKVPRKKSIKKTASKTTIKAFNPTPPSVTRRLKRLGLTQTQFARLLGVSLPSVYNWENAFGKLDLRDRSRKALNRVAELTQDEALAELGDFG
jgi:uncharacterized Zn finger protein/DNA-binding transcriptional regulator YiaG